MTVFGVDEGMTSFEISILKQSIISSTVGTGWGAADLCQGKAESSFDKKQSKSLQLLTAHSESFLTILC